MDGGEDGEEGEPDPEEDVDLLVDDVDGEDALRVVALDRAGGAELAEGALGHAREHARHWVDPGSRLEEWRSWISSWERIATGCAVRSGTIFG